MTRLEMLSARRMDPMVKAALLNEVYRDIQQTDAVKYAVGAMQSIDPDYTKNTFAQGGRVKSQLEQRLTTSCEYRYQGSTTNDTHIKAKSDIDLLVILTAWFWLEPPQQAPVPYAGDDKQDMRNLRKNSLAALKTAFPAADVNASGGKSIKLEGGSLTRTVDVVPATWLNTNMYATTGSETWRGVKVFDAASSLFVSNLPFLHNSRIEDKDNRTFGGMRKAARLMKSLNYDSDSVKMSSYDIVGIAFNMPEALLAYRPPFELRLVDSCLEYCRSLRSNDTLRGQIIVPNGTRRVFDPLEGATVGQLDQLIAELDGLARDILRENARSFVKLAEARVAHPLPLRPIGLGRY